MATVARSARRKAEDTRVHDVLGLVGLLALGLAGVPSARYLQYASSSHVRNIMNGEGRKVAFWGPGPGTNGTGPPFVIKGTLASARIERVLGWGVENVRVRLATGGAWDSATFELSPSETWRVAFVDDTVPLPDVAEQNAFVYSREPKPARETEDSEGGTPRWPAAWAVALAVLGLFVTASCLVAFAVEHLRLWNRVSNRRSGRVRDATA